MARRGSIRIIGAKELARKLKKLPTRIVARSIRKPIREAGKPMVKTAKQLATRETGTLQKSIGIGLKTFRRTGAVQIRLGPRKSITGVGPDGRERKPFKYAHLVEFGNDKLPARPFMRPAWEQHHKRVVKSLSKAILAAVEREAKKL